MTLEDYTNYTNQISVFIEEQKKIKELYNDKRINTHYESLAFFDNDEPLMPPLIITEHTIQFLIFSFAEKYGSKQKKLVQKMRLATAFLQGIDISTNLILEGNYIKAAATLKQDYETIVRIEEVNRNRAKNGKTPNAQNAPLTYKEMYGYLNNIAHISEDVILNFVLKETNSAEISPAKKFNKTIANRLMSYNVAIKAETLRQCLNLYYELAGGNDIHKQSFANYHFVIEICSKIGLLGYENEKN